MPDTHVYGYTFQSNMKGVIPIVLPKGETLPYSGASHFGGYRLDAYGAAGDKIHVHSKFFFKDPELARTALLHYHLDTLAGHKDKAAKSQKTIDGLHKAVIKLVPTP